MPCQRGCGGSSEAQKTRMLANGLRYTGFMHRAARAILVWVMVLAMPLQGWAASMMLYCGPGHHTNGASHGSQQHAEHAHAHDHAHAMDGQPPAHVHADGDSDSGSDDSCLSKHPAKGSRSACAACCAALAWPANVVPLAPAGPGGVAPVERVQPLASHLPETPDRPPRSTLA